VVTICWMRVVDHSENIACQLWHGTLKRTVLWNSWKQNRKCTICSKQCELVRMLRCILAPAIEILPRIILQHIVDAQPFLQLSHLLRVISENSASDCQHEQVAV